jgi:hypothetical protein
MKIFISHVASDREWADELANALERSGLDVWHDAADIQPGRNWFLEAGKALERADAMIIVLSSESVKSPLQMREIEFALTSPRLKNRVVAVERRTRGETPFRVPWILKELAYIPHAGDARRAAQQVRRFLDTPAEKKRAGA